MIRTLVFDWDGTLHDTEALYGAAFRHAYGYLVEAGYAPPRRYTDREVSVYLGMNARTMWNCFMPQLPPEIRDRASDIIGQDMENGVRGGQAVLYPGALDTLATLKQRGFSLVFLSNCKHAYMDAHREMFDLDRYFDGFYCCQDYDFRPKTEIFRHIRERFPGEYVLIGDRYSDLEPAFSYGCFSIGCTYGFGDGEELQQARCLASDVRQLPRLIEALGVECENAYKI